MTIIAKDVGGYFLPTQAGSDLMKIMQITQNTKFKMTRTNTNISSLSPEYRGEGSKKYGLSRE